MKNKFVLTLVILIQAFFYNSIASAYFENYPPYKFKDGPPAHLEAKPLLGTEEKYSKDGITVILKDSDKGYHLSIKDDKKVVLDRSSDEYPRPQEVYRADLNGDGLQDFIVISWWGGAGLGSHEDQVELFLKKKDGSFTKIQYNALAAGLQDFVDLDKDGRYEVIMTGLYYGPGHNYFSYKHYQIKDYRLVESKTLKGFPKFVWMTNKPNDKDTTHLTSKQKKMALGVFESDITYS